MRKTLLAASRIPGAQSSMPPSLLAIPRSAGPDATNAPISAEGMPQSPNPSNGKRRSVGDVRLRFGGTSDNLIHSLALMPDKLRKVLRVRQ
jgi:hypothetical protein